jgi:hypothetical protein
VDGILVADEGHPGLSRALAGPKDVEHFEFFKQRRRGSVDEVITADDIAKPGSGESIVGLTFMGAVDQLGVLTEHCLYAGQLRVVEDKFELRILTPEIDVDCSGASAVQKSGDLRGGHNEADALGVSELPVGDTNNTAGLIYQRAATVPRVDWSIRLMDLDIGIDEVDGGDTAGREGQRQATGVAKRRYLISHPNAAVVELEPVTVDFLARLEQDQIAGLVGTNDRGGNRRTFIAADVDRGGGASDMGRGQKQRRREQERCAYAARSIAMVGIAPVDTVANESAKLVDASLPGSTDVEELSSTVSRWVEPEVADGPAKSADESSERREQPAITSVMVIAIVSFTPTNVPTRHPRVG